MVGYIAGYLYFNFDFVIDTPLLRYLVGGLLVLFAMMCIGLPVYFILVGLINLEKEESNYENSIMP